MGDYEKAESLLNGAVEMSIATYTEQHNVAISALDNLCFLFLQQERGEEALGLAKRAHQSWVQQYGDKQPYARTLRLNIAQAMLLQNNFNGARMELEEILSESIDSEFSTRYLAQLAFASLEMQTGDSQASLDRLLVTLGTIKKLNLLMHAGRFRRGSTQYIYLQTISLRGRILSELRQWDPAEVDLVQSHRGFQRMLGQRHPTTRKALARLKQHYRKTRQTEKLADLE